MFSLIMLILFLTMTKLSTGKSESRTIYFQIDKYNPTLNMAIKNSVLAFMSKEIVTTQLGVSLNFLFIYCLFQITFSIIYK